MPATPSRRPASAAAVSAGYSGTPLPKKLGVKPLSRLALFGAPDGFPRTLGELPDGARLVRAGAAADLAVWFVRSRADLRKDIARRARAIPTGGLWIAWRKQSSGEAGDVGEADVRAAGLAAGLVDYKICAVDGTWSGLKFATRRATAATRRQP
ncbi:MAG TPA: DUF3052 domain-containing protein [Verrucomicrobiae bacterium]|nr:DUF3052 domain-containing protein [Verrucomicrobiae bacterium]